jgi:hypothetical protein
LEEAVRTGKKIVGRVNLLGNVAAPAIAFNEARRLAEETFLLPDILPLGNFDGRHLAVGVFVREAGGEIGRSENIKRKYKRNLFRPFIG